MAISASHYNYGFLSKAQVNSITKPATTDKEIQEPQKNTYHQKTPRELLDMPYGCTLTCPINKTTKGLTPEELFIVQYNSATTLSDGSKLLRPVSLALGKVDIIPTEDNKYDVTIDTNRGYNTITKTMSEEELIHNKALAKGTIKKSPDEQGKYIVSFIDKDGDKRKFLATEKGALKLLEENFLYM